MSKLMPRYSLHQLVSTQIYCVMWCSCVRDLLHGLRRFPSLFWHKYHQHHKLKGQYKMKLNYFTEISLFFSTIPEYANAIYLILAHFTYLLLRKAQLFTLSTAFLGCFKQGCGVGVKVGRNFRWSRVRSW
jgi:hypothetical protein